MTVIFIFQDKNSLVRVVTDVPDGKVTTETIDRVGREAEQRSRLPICCSMESITNVIRLDD